MIDCLLVNKPGFEWVSYLPYLITGIVGLAYFKKVYKLEKKINAKFIVTLIAVFIFSWLVVFIFIPRECA